MGITGGLVKSVFSKSSNNTRTEKRRWNSVRSYLCGDELSSGHRDEDYLGSVESFSEARTTITQFNSIAAEHNSVPEEEDSDSVHDFSEATVTQLAREEKQQDFESEAAKDERAAIIIQSAFRGFLARRVEEGTGFVIRSESTNRDSSIGTSIEVQMGNSVEDERIAIQHRTNQKLRPQVIKEDWDDSTVSSNISRLRIQSRQEASTRRERALAYAFSQQLRVCSKKKEVKSNAKETSMGWSWLERWMATRLPESS